jgi:Phage integrase family
VTAAWDAAGLQRITLHECRHTYASLLMAAGYTIKELMEFMGHADLQMVNRYVKLLPQPGEDDAAQRLNDYLRRSLSGGDHVRMPAGHAGGSGTRVGGGSGETPAISRVERKTHRVRPSGRAADALTRAGQPSAWSCSPTAWNAGHWRRVGCSGGSPTRVSRASSVRSATRDSTILHRHRSRGRAHLGGSAASARARYHSAQTVASLSAK